MIGQEDPSKTEKATQKRRDKQRKEGNVAKGQEIPKVMSLLSGVLALRFMIGFYNDQFTEIYRWTFLEAINLQVDKPMAYALFTWAVQKMALLVVPFLLVIAFVAFITMRLQIGPLWTTKPLEPKFGKLFNIMGGIKKLMLSPDALLKLGKSLLQALAVAIAPYIVLKQELPNLLPLFHANVQGIIAFILSAGYKMVCYALIPMFIIAVADLVYERWNYEEQIKMTKDEIKDERKQAEGDPKVKQQQRQKMMEVMASRMFQDIPKADVVITNPTHYAVALQYDPLKAPAPLVLAKGVNKVAERIKEVARENSIPIEENKPLAQALYKQVEIGETIPEELFQAVAAILAKLEKFKRRRQLHSLTPPPRNSQSNRPRGVKNMAQTSAKTVIPKVDYTKFAKQGDILLAGGVVVILFVMLIPLPTPFIDFMLSVSISLGLVILVTSMFMTSPLEFSIFPSLLLVTTLLRLALNVATTRAILLHGDEGTSAAGSVIQSFGEFVVGGNYVIGIVIFMILFILNKTVIVTGTTRIAEVAARFTLDAMPGKQMAIEADLNAGLIDEEQATKQRDNLRREADFYGAMDGAGKFVSGDVKAGLMITAINIIGGFLIGVLQKNMPWMDAAQTYTLLTIGDGLVATIPSLIISTSAGIIVSRAAAEAKMGEEFIGQLSFHHRALKLVSGILVIFGIVPGMPTIPFLTLAGIVFTVGQISSKQQRDFTVEQEEKEQKQPSTLDTPEEVQALLPLDQLELEVGYGLIPLVDEEQSGNLLSRIRSIRRQFALDMGVVVPSLHLRDNLQLKPGEYRVLIKGNPVASAELLIDHYLAMDPGDAKHRIEGVETVEPAFNLPAVWIPEAQKEEAMLAGYTVVDPSTVIATHLTEVFRRNLHEFLGRQETQELLDNLSKRAPKAVESLVPAVLSIGGVQKVLQGLVQENVSIRDLLTIVETLADYGAATQDPNQLTEYVRARMGRTIVKPYLGDNGVLPIITLNPQIDEILNGAMRPAEQGGYLALEPGTAQQIIQAINRSTEEAMVADGQPILLVTPQLRSQLAQLLTRFIPTLPVISQAEIPADVKIQSVATVEL